MRRHCIRCNTDAMQMQCNTNKRGQSIMTGIRAQVIAVIGAVFVVLRAFFGDQIPDGIEENVSEIVMWGFALFMATKIGREK